MTSTAVSTTTTRPNAPAIAASATVRVEPPDGAARAWRLAALACSAGAFGLVVVVLTAVLVIRRRHGTGPSGRHAG